jgi:tetratricopeptide (TPR) repeat protein
MTAENELIHKSYYLTMIDEHAKEHPIQQLGVICEEEMKRQRPNLSSIRFAQGEVYFLNKDYEAAIFKWRNPLDEQLLPWAQKNIADAHLEMGLLEDAEKFYKEVKTESIALRVEVFLQLFSLYIQQGKQVNAVDAIKHAVQIDPDYADVTEIAQTFFENIEDWDSAVELAVKEAIRTKSLTWFEVLGGYAEQGYTIQQAPNYFREVLLALLELDKYRFESLCERMWIRYKQSDYYIQWLEEINQILLHYQGEESYSWKKLPSLFHRSYIELISGQYLVSDISKLLQDHLANWLNLSSVSDSLISSTAILAWDEIFHDLDEELIHHAAYHFEHSNAPQNGRHEGIMLFESIETWAEKEGLLTELTEFIKPMTMDYNLEGASSSKIRSIIKASIEFLIEKRIEVEQEIAERINWKEKVIGNLKAIQLELEEMEKEEVNVILDSFRQVSHLFMDNLMNKLPELLQNCSEIIREDSDFRKVHVEINDEMNRRIATYMENTALSDFNHAIQGWLVECKQEFKQSQNKLDALSGDFNVQFGEEKLVLEGDFKLLDDWKRDLDRIARGMRHREKVNIMLRNNPSQLLLKGAGKLLGSIAKNKEKLHIKYKNYIENENYSETIQELINPFLNQLESFERSLEWDVNNFYANSFGELTAVSDELQGDIVKLKSSLDTMHESPEIYRDPLTLFELRLRQFELMNTIG